MKIKFSSFFPLFLLCFIFSERRIYLLIAFFAAFLHELGHIAASKICGIRLRSLSLDILGARLNTDEKLSSFKSEIILCAGGPIVNLFFAAVSFLILNTEFNDHLAFFAATSLSLGALNLLPIKSFDGGRILDCILSRCFNIYTSEIILSISSFLCCFSLWGVSVYLLIKIGSSLSLFVFSLSLFSRIFIAR